MIQFSKRLAQTEEYYFSKKLKEVKALKEAGKPIINLGIGSPDLSPPKAVFQNFETALQETQAFQYQAYRGIDELRNAMSNFYKIHYAVQLDAEDEILPLMGSKEGIMLTSMAFLNEGDEVLIPNPGYPTYAAVTKLLNCVPNYYALSGDKNWHPDLAELQKKDLSKVKMMWVNYPNMPTGADADRSQLQEIINFAIQHDILLVNDNPYSMILTENPFSIFQLTNAKKIALELNSMSKSFNLAGFRVGFLAGKSDFISAVLKVKSNMDSGMFFPIQQTASKVLKLDRTWFEELNTVYRKRREWVWKIADQLNLDYDKNSTGLFVWAKQKEAKKAADLADQLLYEANLFVTPGHIFGSQGEAYLRFSLCVVIDDLKTSLERVQKLKKKVL
ncbi:pyridoxal phosphate-dependent aminotransferase [Psychroflexus planctonicus]|uniref:Aminotransferase n=1 Tax=Psychroflexus planctonicus TaxID=1526575 RepID=A0ABQ1SE85_9FLAO|nr:aminotransferase class I/II-fold pyridoxal phosphate-dependent enzyme [Psychroflexus planctonicus]GGE26436.1 aminotransferase [Psychroflexus planctonicus]